MSEKGTDLHDKVTISEIHKNVFGNKVRTISFTNDITSYNLIARQTVWYGRVVTSLMREPLPMHGNLWMVIEKPIQDITESDVIEAIKKNKS